MFTVLQRKDQTNDYSVSSFWIREEGGGGDIFFQNLSADLKCVMLILFFDM